MQLECPNCNCKLDLQILLKIGQKNTYKTRLEMAEEHAKPFNERKWIVIEYDGEKDRFLVQKGKIYNDT